MIWDTTTFMWRHCIESSEIRPRPAYGILPLWFITDRDYGLILIKAWIDHYIHYKEWDEITYPFSNFNGCTAKIWEWISDFIPHFTGNVITYAYWD